METLEGRSEILENFEMWYWRRMEEIIWTNHVRNKKVLRRVKEERNILHKIKIIKDNLGFSPCIITVSHFY